MTNKVQYSAPELKLVGETDDLVFGLIGVGGDYAGELYISDMDFQDD
jgi:hypothetical protein